MGAYGNTWRATQRPPLDQMEVTLTANPSLLKGQPGETISYTLTLQNSGSVNDNYWIGFESNNPDFSISFAEYYPQDHYFVGLSPQSEITVTLWVEIPLTSTLSLSNTIVVTATGQYGVQSEAELTTLITAFQERNGQVVMEAEHFAIDLDHGERSWLTQTILSGYAGSGYVNAWPDTDQRFTTTYTTTSPELRYSVNFTNTGVYTVWLRGYAPNSAGDSVYVGLDEQLGKILSGFAPRSWSWAKSNAEAPGNTVTVEITQPGFHLLRIWQREDGLRLDRILLTTNNNYNPTGEGPAESEFE
jgi:hypothetical protein